MDHFLRTDDLTPEGLHELLELASRLKEDRHRREEDTSTRIRSTLRGKTVAMLFEKPSTRTRVSFQVAVSELGGSPLPLSSNELQLGRGETISDTAQVLSRYCHAIVVRTFGQDRLDELAASSSVPVVNALTDLEHPCQALADLQTLREEFGALDGRSLAYIGDGNNVANSLLVAGAMVGMSVRVGHPEGYAPDADIVARAERLAAANGGEIVLTTDAAEAARGADALYADVWTSMGQEAENEERLRTFVPYRITAELMGEAADDAIFLHCLPAHRGEEVTAEVIDGARSRVFDQAENRLHAQKALLATLVGEGV